MIATTTIIDFRVNLARGHRMLCSLEITLRPAFPADADPTSEVGISRKQSYKLDDCGQRNRGVKRTQDPSPGTVSLTTKLSGPGLGWLPHDQDPPVAGVRCSAGLGGPSPTTRQATRADSCSASPHAPGRRAGFRISYWVYKTDTC